MKNPGTRQGTPGAEEPRVTATVWTSAHAARRVRNSPRISTPSSSRRTVAQRADRIKRKISGAVRTNANGSESCATEYPNVEAAKAKKETSMNRYHQSVKTFTSEALPRPNARAIRHRLPDIAPPRRQWISVMSAVSTAAA